MKIVAELMHYQKLNETIRLAQDGEVIIENCIGQRYIGSGMSVKNIQITGTPGNALGAYLNGSRIVVYGNTQEAVGDTMNSGEIVIHGSAGDAPGYAMRGGKIFIEGNAGYRAGIHMKQYQDKIPLLVVGGRAGSFLGEYQAGGTIIVLGLNGDENRPPVGNFCGTGMHGGKIYLRSNALPHDLPAQVIAKEADEADMAEIEPHLMEFCREFNKNYDEVRSHMFYLLTPDSKNPYKQLYTMN